MTPFVLLYVLNQTLFISAPSLFTECYVTLDDGSKNDSRPTNWARMEPGTTHFNRICKIDLKEQSSIFAAKFRLFFNDRSYVTTDWQQVLSDATLINYNIQVWKTIAFIFIFSTVCCLSCMILLRLLRNKNSTTCSLKQVERGSFS